MSENINLDSNNLSIPEDAFEQFQVNSMYEEEEYITLSDIVSPEPAAQQLPSDISEIPYDNEVVLSANDDPNSDNLAGTATSDPANSVNVSVYENNENIEQPTEQVPDQNNQGRPKRIRKQKSYVDDFVTDLDEKLNLSVENDVDKKNASNSTPTKRRRGRKPKQNIAQNEMTQPEGIDLGNVVEQTPSKRGRKKVIKELPPETLNNFEPVQNQETLGENSSEVVSQDVQDDSTSIKTSARKQTKRQKNNSVKANDDSTADALNSVESALHKKGRPKKNLPKEPLSNSSEPLVDTKNILSGELMGDNSFADIPPKTQKKGRRGRPKNVSSETTGLQLLEADTVIPQQLQTSVEDSNFIIDQKIHPKRGRKRKVQKAVHTENNVSDDDDELDNVSLKTLSKKQEDNGEKCLDLETATVSNVDPKSTENDEIDVGDEMILSEIKETLDEVNTEVQDMELDETVETYKTELDNSELNIKSADNTTKDIDNGDNYDTTEMENDSLLLEDTSKRPVRRRAKKVMHYDEESDEDPFANVELSDDEPSGKRGRYYSDEEYVPGSEKKKGGRAANDATTDEDSDISEIDDDLEGYQKGKRKRLFSANRNRGKKCKKDEIQPLDVNVTTIVPKVGDEIDDIEGCLQSSVIQANENSIKKPTSVYTEEFENFIAQKIQGTNIKIKKVSSEQSSQSAPLEIPILDPDAKKAVDVSVQTNIVKTISSGVQTYIQHEIGMKDNVPLTTEQSEKACEFLKSIVKTTSELGQLMTEKSEDFISKKINLNHVTDTFKMDYCVKKSFLLLKLAKHNIVQMEDDLAKQYEDFLKRTDLISHRQEEKVIKATEKDNDSDCEIVEEIPSTTVKKEKPKFNPKTVFLNKELSIKIAKKPASKNVADKCKDKLNIKNKTSVWISDSVMVKKVKPTQSFLAQDSRTKKPPDCFVTNKMVSDFFDSYYKKLAPSICAPFTNYSDWQGLQRNYVCSYFFVKLDKASDASTSYPESSDILCEGNNKDTATEHKTDNTQCVNEVSETASPRSLITLCTEVLKVHMKLYKYHTLQKNDSQINFEVQHRNSIQSPDTLFRLCLNIIGEIHYSIDKSESKKYQEVEAGILLNCNKTNTFLNVESMRSDFENNEAMSNEESPRVSPYFDEMVPLLDFEKDRVLHNVENREILFDVETEKVLSDIKNTESLPKVSSVKVTSDVKESKLQLLIEPETLPIDKNVIVMTLKTLCLKKIIELLRMPIEEEENGLENNDSASENSIILSDNGSYMSVSNYEIDDMIAELDLVVKTEVKSLFSLCVAIFQKVHKDYVKNVQKGTLDDLDNFIEKNTSTVERTPKSLKCLTFELINNMMHMNFSQNSDVTVTKLRAPVYKVKRLADICFKNISLHMTDNYENDIQINKNATGMTINCVNTLSEEAFHNMEEENVEDDYGEDFYEEDNFGGDFNSFQEEDNNWESQVHIQEFKPCIDSSKQMSESQVNEGDTLGAENSNLPVKETMTARIKTEPSDEMTEGLVDTTIVKTEVLHHDEMAIIPESIVTKQEHTENAGDNRDRVPLQRHSSSSFDVDSFEDFVRRNKMMHALDEPNDEAYTQSGQRVRRQHEPDYMNEYDPSLNLLVPQTFEPLSVVNAKGVLMASSSDDERGNQKSTSKKKDKRGKVPKKGERPKKGESKQPNKEVVNSKSKEIPAVKGNFPHSSLNELTILTRRMREKIRQEEKKVASSDSEGENIPIARKKDRKENEKAKSSKNTKENPAENEKAKSSKNTKENPAENETKAKSSKSAKESPTEDEIQCSNVDSTEQIDQNDSTEDDKNFTGFSTVDQNEITRYQKYVKFVYDKIMPKHVENNEKSNVPDEEKREHPSMCNSNENDDRSCSPLINYDEPAEMLECQPTMPIFDESFQNEKQRKKLRPKSKIVKEAITAPAQENVKNTEISQEIVENDKPVYTERNGWQCYPINPNETKLYENAAIILEKLPETFVETYFEYQQLTGYQDEDKEVDRLINLNTLNRSSIKEVQKIKGKGKVTKNEELGRTTDTSRVATPTSDGCAELTASEDEGANVDDELPPPVPSRHTNENNLAKSSLMDDSDSEETLSKIKEEPNNDTQADPKVQSKKKPKGKAPTQTVKSEHPESLMLTADKSLNKELNLLHAPVVLSNEVSEKGDKGLSPRTRNKRGLRGHTSRDYMKNEEGSSSEEEKQWVSTKEKLLKRMGKKQDTASADDAKRAKLVTEFIERRGVAPDGGARKRGARGRGRKRNSRKALEREKQMRVLSHELFGAPVDPALMGTRHAQFSQSYFKGRRNIRKVIDKKSLARSTVIANMEEFERKCRLNQRQAQLSELLGCEEGVNVLVINDEVCLEYGFEQQSPLISVHPFFTKVMKAHQYEGVKFMWDACFETLEKVESGHPGGGCILAHCMGLGKTLQVLALLHTVLTHPRVGMQRVLVCCPLSTVLNWVDEIHKWIGPVTDQIKVFELSKLKKTSLRAYQLEDWYSGGGIFIIGYELFRSLTTLDPELDDIRPTIVQKIRTALLDPGPDIVVCDEGHLLKNDCSVLAVAMSRVATKRRIVLTGTPMQNNLREYYCMVNFVKPNLLGTYSEYSNRFENPIMNGQHRDSREEDIKLMKQRTHILHKVLEGCLQRQEASVLYPYLPKKHEYTVFISLTKVQWDLYKHYINNYSNNSKQSVLKDFHILQKIWSHPQVLHNFQTKRRDELATQIKPEKLEDDLAHEDLTSEVLKVEEARADEAAEAWWLQFLDGGAMLDSLECSNKFTVVFKILDECIALGDKVLIFSTSLFTMDALEYFLKKINKWSLGQEYYRLDGSVPAEVRQKWCREFNAELNHRTKLFLISTRAGSLGLNMVAANRVIILDTSWNPAHDIQSIFRVYRFGQKKDCYIYRLVALGTMEQKIYERSVTKQAVSCRVVDEQQIDRHYNMAELTELYKYDEQGLSVLGGVAVGVTDVALLRVARHPALHAVHEHDSLLRGSSEQQLPEHERAAAWMQFQQEHAHKQMQNQLTSSFSLHLPMPNAAPAPHLQTYRDLVQGTGHLPDIKPETPNLLVPYQPKPPGKAGRPRKKVPPPEALQQLPSESEEIKTQKIMHILIKHNYQDRQGPKEITELVSMVQKIVACGRVPPGKFHNIIAREIAEVLLINEITPSTQENTNSQEKRGRGRPRKQTEEGDTKPYIPPWGVSSEPSTSKDYSTYTPRRRAAINAEKQIEKESAIEADNDRQEHIDDDWQNDSSEEITPETKPQKKTTTPRAVTVKTENVTKPNENDSILLSDDDEPAPTTAKQTKNTETKKPEQKKTEEKKADKEVIPLHPSLLDNKNFIKIVAHTYLEGNPMLDEDAAILAAQYSTLKAKKEIEATGQAIVNGPIYDIAVKVLGIDILEKLHTTNPVAKKLVPAPSKAPEVKSEPVAEPRRPGPRLKAKGIGELTGNSDPPPVTPTAPTVVPVGLINRTGGITPTAAGVTPVAQFAPQPREESILPHDDDVIAHRPAPAPASTKNIFTKNCKPLIFNSILATKSSAISSAQPKPVILNSVLTNTNGPAQPKIPKLIISAGKLLPATGFSTIIPPKVTPAATPAVPNPPPASDTICLDSDEETPPEPAPKPRKRVAVKSTAKPAGPPAAPPAPVPVSISAANPQFSFLHQPETITTSQLNTILQQQPPKYSSTKILQPIVSEGTITLGYAPPANSASKFVVVPASQVPGLSRPPSGVSQPLLRSLPDQNYIPQNPVYPTTSLPQTVTTQPMTSTQPLAPEPPRPKRSMPTRCKPGDILRVTRTGQIEVLNREEDDVSIVEDAAAPPPSQPARPPVKARGRTATPQEIPTPTPPPQNTPQPPENTVTTSDRTRKVSVSSSSSSDSSRPSSPEPDPLSIFKDVVHIKAPEDDSPKIKQPKTIGNTSISKATGPVSKTIPPSKVTYNKEPLKTQTKQSTPAKSVSQDEIMKHISKTDTILKKLDKALSEKNQPTPQRATRSQKASTTATKQTPVSSVTAIDTIIDLDSYVSGGPTQKGGAKYTTKPAPPAKQTKPAPSKSTVVPKPTMTTTKEPTKTKEPVKTIVGTSKDIIISITGKSSTMTTTANSGNKARVATMDKLAPTTYAGKKRPAPSDAGPQKKKNAPMTLKDFNIDDIDDIIELE